MTAPQDPYGQLPGGRLDPAQDPDRYDPAREEAPAGPVDWSQDPDRYRPEDSDVERQPLVLGRTGGTRQTQPDLLGEGSFDDKPSPYLFLLGLLGVVLFLGLVALVFSNLSP